jgi:sodium-dependent dicarboxylate transporter 2/3/5
VALVLLAVAWAALGRLAPGTGRAPLATAFDRRLPPVSAAERRVAAVAGLAALAWIARPFAEGLVPGAGLSDAGIAMLAALALFVLPDGAGGRLLDWEGAATIRWDVLILFGGGLALAAILDATGLAAWIGGRVGELRALPPVALLLLMVALIVYVGELASNTAMAALFLPVAGAAAAALGAEPIAFLMTVALGASVGFMLPVATPPNAIVFSHPAVTRAGMLRAGAPLDAAGILVVVGLSSVLAPLVVP